MQGVLTHGGGQFSLTASRPGRFQKGGWPRNQELKSSRRGGGSPPPLSRGPPEQIHKPVKGQVVNISGFEGHTVSVATIQPCRCDMKPALDNIFKK